MAGTWTLEDDLSLWAQRSKSTTELAQLFTKTPGAIRSRLKHLQDPTHKAYRRRITSVPGASSRVDGLGSLRNSNASSSIAAVVTSARKNVVDLTNNDCSSYFAQSHQPPTPNSHILQSTTKPTEKQPSKAIESSTLNTDQTNAASQIFSGSNAFLTGAAGVGKSYLLNYLIEGLKTRHGQDCVVVSAATGIAATHINGVTIHSWAGVRLGVGGARVLVPRVLENAAACARWRKARVLILDEVRWIVLALSICCPCSFSRHDYTNTYLFDTFYISNVVFNRLA